MAKIKRRILVSEGDSPIAEIGDPWKNESTRAEAKKDLDNLLSTVKSNLNSYCHKLNSANKIFAAFAKTEIEKIDTKDIPIKIINTFMLKVISGFSLLIPGIPEATAKLGKFLLSELQTAIINGLKETLKLPPTVKKFDKKGLLEYLRNMEAKESTQIFKYDKALTALSEEISGAQKCLMANNKNQLKDSHKFLISTFYKATTDERQALIYYYFNIPDSKRATILASKCYHNLYYEFGNVYGLAALSMREQSLNRTKIPGVPVHMYANKFYRGARAYWDKNFRVITTHKRIGPS